MTNNPGAKVPALRLSSIDAFRGLVMFLMMAEVIARMPGVVDRQHGRDLGRAEGQEMTPR